MLCAARSTQVVESGAVIVLRAMVPKAREVFRIIVEQQSSEEGGAPGDMNQEKLPFQLARRVVSTGPMRCVLLRQASISTGFSSCAAISSWSAWRPI